MTGEELLEVGDRGRGWVDAESGERDEFVTGQESREQGSCRAETGVTLGHAGGEGWGDRDRERHIGPFGEQAEKIDLVAGGDEGAGNRRRVGLGDGGENGNPERSEPVGRPDARRILDHGQVSGEQLAVAKE